MMERKDAEVAAVLLCLNAGCLVLHGPQVLWIVAWLLPACISNTQCPLCIQLGMSY